MILPLGHRRHPPVISSLSAGATTLSSMQRGPPRFSCCAGHGRCRTSAVWLHFVVSSGRACGRAFVNKLFFHRSSLEGQARFSHLSVGRARSKTLIITPHTNTWSSEGPRCVKEFCNFSQWCVSSSEEFLRGTNSRCILARVPQSTKTWS